MKLIELVCKKCGAKLEMDSSRDSIFCPYCGTKNFIDDEASELRRVEDVKLEARQKNHEQTLKEKQDYEELQYKESFKRSKLKKLIIIFMFIVALFTVLAFANNATVAGIVGIIQMCLFIASLLMGLHVIKEPFKYCHRILAYIAFALIIVFLVFVPKGGSSSRKCNSFKWEYIKYHERLPEPKKLEGDIHSNSTTGVWLTLCDYDLDDYYEYKNELISRGFIYETLDYTDSYYAYDLEGYRVNIDLDDNDNELMISIDPPSENSSYEDDDEEEEENKQVEPEKEEIKPSEPQKEEKPTEPEKEEPKKESNGLRADFKKAMDSYEKLIDEYVSFMKKYNKNPTNASLLKDYANYAKKYTEALDAFDKWESEDLNAAEAKYYIEVQTRCNKKLASIY